MFLERANACIERGWPVFPVSRKTKAPCVAGGFKVATMDMDQIKRWAREFPDANVGVPTGPITGLAVLDVDGEEGEQSLQRLAAQRGVHFRKTLTASSGRGRHLYYRFVNGLKSSASKLGPGLDIRAEGGSIIAPPSVHASGRPYAWIEDAPMLRFPLSAIVALTPPPPTYHAHGAVPDLDRIVDRVRFAPVGTRNHALYRAAYTAGGVVASKGSNPKDAELALINAGLAAGLDRVEATNTVRSGLRSGLKAPF